MLKPLGRLAALAAIVFLGVSGQASAETYPSRPVHIIVGYAPGGSVDIVARIIADKLSQMNGQRFIVDNRPGGGTIIASELVARAAPDGYTVMLADIAHGANPALKAHLPYDTEKDFAPIVLVAFFPAILAVDKSLPVNDLQEFLAYAKARKGQLNYSSSGIGSMNYLASELLNTITGADIQQVPYQSGGQAMSALVGGFVQMLITTAPPLLSFKDKVKILAVSSDKRLASLPNVPTFAEAGLPDYNVQLWQGLLSPAGTDKMIVAKLNRDFNAVLAMPDVRQRLEALGGDIVGGSPDKFAKYVDDEIAKWKRVIPAELRQN
jgi:tripartite-type tricarboxylate transporter receptor subunit TctC